MPRRPRPGRAARRAAGREAPVSAAIVARVEALLGERVVATRGVTGGFSSAARFVVELAGGATAFVKAAVDDDTARWLRDELRIYRDPDLAAAGIAPGLIAVEDDPPLIVLEDLSDARRPPPWTPGDVRAVLDLLDRVHAAPVPASLPGSDRYAPGFRGWARTAEDPAPVLRLCLCSERWLEGALPALVAAEAAMELEGDALLHLDVRSDNLAIRPDGAVLFDWNWACRGNPDLDAAFWSPHLALEGGPKPWELRPGRPDLAAAVAGFFCFHAGLPTGRPGDPPPAVRDFQMRQGVVALDWAARELGLPAPLSAGSCFGGLGRDRPR